jgi:magnesium-protoporphyrin IX monomethyl ester (oxidative) cyclase
MKILLVRPPARHVKGSAKPSASLPLGLLYIAAVLEKNDYAVEIYDAQINVQMPISQGPDGVMHMGDRWEVIRDEMARRNPDMVGIINPFTTQFDNAVKVAQIAREVNKNILIVVGGNHPTVQPEDFFSKTQAVDIVCMGEGEYTMLEIAQVHSQRRDWKGIPGTAVQEDHRVKINGPRPYIQDLDSLPFLLTIS